MRKELGFTLIELMIVIAIIAIIAAIAIPGLLNSQRSSNERNASTSLKTVATAEAQFRSEDKDNNQQRDFWTGDVAGLYCIDNTSTGAAVPAAVKLVEVSIALADMFTMPGSLTNGNYSKPIQTFGVRSSKAGYWYGALLSDLQVVAQGGNGFYRQDTDGTGDLVHNTSRFCVAAMPETYGSSGDRVFIVNENNTMFARDFGADVLGGGVIPPVPTGVFDGNWPTDATLAATWSKMD